MDSEETCMHAVPISVKCPACEEMHWLCGHGLLPGSCDQCKHWIDNVVTEPVRPPYLRLVWSAGWETVKVNK